MTDLRNLIVRLRLSSVNNVRELHRILNEENWDIITHNIPVALFSVELDSEATNIADCVSGAAAPQHC